MQSEKAIKQGTEWVKKSEASRQLGITRAQLDRVLAQSGAPAAVNKRFRVADIRAFMDKQGSVAGKQAETMIRKKEYKLDLENLLLEEKLKVARQESVHIKQLYPELARVAGAQKALLISRIERELPVKVEGLSLDERREFCRSTVVELCREMQELLLKYQAETKEVA